MTPQEWVNHFTVYKTPWDKFTPDEQKTYLPFIINIWLAQDPNLIEVVNQVQRQQVPNRDHYNFYLKFLPKKRLNYRWIKAKKKIYGKDVVERIAAFYSEGYAQILDSIPLLSEQQIIKILEQTGLNNKSIKQLLK